MIKFTKTALYFVRINAVCGRNDPSERLGYGFNGTKDICKQRWFDGFNWQALRRHTLAAPYLPKVIVSLTDS